MPFARDVEAISTFTALQRRGVGERSFFFPDENLTGARATQGSSARS